ncbi:MAG: hypothetical protein PVG96_15870 [Desulfobacterales bacterium]
MIKFMVKIIVPILLLMGCAGLEMEKENWKKFDQTSNAYLLSYRWGDYDVVYGFKKPPNINEQAPEVQDLSDLRVTSYKVKQTVMSKDEKIVIQIVDFEYYRTRDVTLRSLTDHQKWEYDEEKERWYLTSDMPHFE